MVGVYFNIDKILGGFCNFGSPLGISAKLEGVCIKLPWRWLGQILFSAKFERVEFFL